MRRPNKPLLSLVNTPHPNTTIPIPVIVIKLVSALAKTVIRVS